MSTQPAHATSRPALPTPLLVLLQAAATLVAMAAAGAVAGVVWFWLWSPPVGVVESGRWFLPDEAGLRGEFSGTALYVLVALVTGLVVGALVAVVLDRSELVTLVCVAGGAVLAAWVMYHVGIHDSPPDPRSLAAGAADGTSLPARLEVARRTPFVALPVGALLAFALVLLFVPKRGLRRRELASADESGESVETGFRDGAAE